MTSLRFKKFVFTLLFGLITIAVHAQFISATIGINGLTCSQCSRSVEMQLRKLSFVKDVKMDLEQTRGAIFFKENKKVNIEAIADAVKDAGFSVRFLKAEIDRTKVNISEQGCFNLDGNSYTVLSPYAIPEKPILTLQFVGKDYLPGSDFKRYKLPTTKKCKGKTVYYAIAN
jgi:copper chaperone CopZ